MSEETNEIKETKRGKGKWIVLALLRTLIAVLAVAYVMGAMHYRDTFFPNTYINRMDFGNQDSITAAVDLIQQAQTFRLEILGRNPQSPVEGEEETLAVITADDISLTLPDAETKVRELLDQQNEWLWPIALISSESNAYSISGGLSYDSQKLTDVLAGYEAFQSSQMTAPKNAYIGDYSQETGAYELVEDTAGSELDMDAVYAAIDTAIGNAQVSLDSGAYLLDLEAAGYYTEAEVTAEDETLLANLETANTWVQTAITYDWNGNEVVLDGEQISEWITFEDNEPILDEEAVAEFVADNAAEYDTYGKNRNFVTTRGIKLSLRSGAYGWKTDCDTETQELIALIQSGAQEDREPVYTSKGWVKGMNDIGSSYVEIDLSFQHLYLYQNGRIVLESDFVSGNVSNGSTTPAGVFGITYKTKNAVLRGEDYETPVNYWMPFNGNIGMHDATWRSSFGGSIYLTNGSHGCVNLPLDSAAAIYEYMQEGFPVVCYYYSDAVYAELAGPVVTDEPTEEVSTENEGE